MVMKMELNLNWEAEKAHRETHLTLLKSNLRNEKNACSIIQTF